MVEETDNTTTVSKDESSSDRNKAEDNKQQSQEVSTTNSTVSILDLPVVDPLRQDQIDENNKNNISGVINTVEMESDALAL